MKNFNIEKRDAFFLVGIFLLAVCFKLFLMQNRFAIRFDEVNYLKLGVSSAINGISHAFHPYWSPLYPIVVGLFSKITTNYELAGRMVSIFCGSFILFPLYLFTKYHFNRKIAYYTVVLFTFYPSYAFFCTKAQTEPLYILLGTTGVFIAWFALYNRSWSLGLIIGFLFGLAYLTKPEGIGFVIVIVGIICLQIIYFIKNKLRFGSSLVVMIMVILGFSVVASPYILYLHKITGKWTISAKGAANQQFEALSVSDEEFEGDPFQSLSEDNTQVPLDQIFHIGSFTTKANTNEGPVVKITPKMIFLKYSKNFVKILEEGIPQFLTSIIFVFVILGLLGEAWSKERALRELFLFCFFIFFWFVVIPLFHINMRYFLPLLPICFIWVGKGVEIFVIWVNKTLTQSLNFKQRFISNEKLAHLIVLSIFLGFVFLPKFGEIIIRDRWSTGYYADPIEQKIAGLWLKENSENTPVIMCKNHAIDFYAGNYDITKSITIPQNSLDRIIQYAEYRGVDYLVLNERYIHTNPQIAHLLDEKDIPENLKLIYKYQDKPKLKTVIYKLIKN